MLSAITIEEAVPEHTIVETYKNTTPENYAYFDAKVEAIHMILSGIRDDIYSIVDACTTAKEMWIAIERLQQDLDKESYHKLFDILKHYQNEANEIRAKKSKGKEIDKAITPASEEDEDNDPKQAQRDKDMQKNLALIVKYIKNIYKPTNNNIRTSSNTRNKNVDTTPRHMNDNQTGNDRVVLANLIANLKLNHDENKKILKQLKKANASLTHELNECKSALEESNDIRDRCRSVLHDQEIELKKYKKYKNCQGEKEEVIYINCCLCNVMSAPVIPISADSYEESVGSSASFIVLSDSYHEATVILTVLHVALKVESPIVALPAGVLDLVIHSNTYTDPYEDPPSLDHALVILVISPFLFDDHSKPDT
ncbi:hypothetical protein Tco_0794585 [Tanacetum coccineum]